jgi:hypothetical protein
LRLGLHHQPESIAMDVHDLDLGIVFQVFTELGDIHIHTAAIEIGIASPDFLQSLIAW